MVTSPISKYQFLSGHEFTKWATEELRDCTQEDALALGAEMMKDRLIFPLQKKVTTFETNRIYRCTNRVCINH